MSRAPLRTGTMTLTFTCDSVSTMAATLVGAEHGGTALAPRGTYLIG